jgi:hypothetical protein
MRAKIPIALEKSEGVRLRLTQLTQLKERKRERKKLGVPAANTLWVLRPSSGAA